MNPEKKQRESAGGAAGGVAFAVTGRPEGVLAAAARGVDDGWPGRKNARMKLTAACSLPLALLLLAGCSPQLREQAAERAAAEVVAAIPPDVHLRILAVAPVEGSGSERVERALLARFTSEGRFTVLEREKLNALLAEQGNLLGGVVDAESRIELGRMLGAEGLVFVKVISSGPGVLSERLRIHFRLDDLQLGNVIVAKDIDVEAPVAHRREIGAVAVGALLLAVLGGGFVAYRRRWRRRRRDTRRDRLAGVRQRLRRVRQRLEDARSEVVAGRDSAGALRVEDAIRAVQDLEQRLDHVAATVLDAKARAIDKAVVAVCAAAETLEAAVRERDRDAAAHAIGEVERLAADAGNQTR